MSGTMITGIKTTLKNANTCWATGPTKAYSLLPIWKKGHKEAQHAAHVRSAAHPHPPSDPRGDLRLARGLPAEALDRAPRLRLARG